MSSKRRPARWYSPLARPAMASTPNVRFGGLPSKLHPSPPSAPRIIFGARSRNPAGTRSNTHGGSLTWQSAEITRMGGTLPPATPGARPALLVPCGHGRADPEDHLRRRPRGRAPARVAAVAPRRAARRRAPGRARLVLGRLGRRQPGVPEGGREHRDGLVGLRGPGLVPPDAQRVGGLRRVRVVDGADRVRPDAPRLLRRRRPPRR